jgi:hypothetical protein
MTGNMFEDAFKTAGCLALVLVVAISAIAFAIGAWWF